MTSLDDLIRDTLTERAHDVDGLALIATPPPRRTGRRWAAVGTVVAVAAAILVAVVLVAPWRGASDRNAAPPAIPTPPAGMQWVSVHGITLTVPDSWAVGPFPCSAPTTSAVVVPGPVFYCPVLPSVPGTPGDASIVRITVLNGQPEGDEITVAGRPAYRSVHVDEPPGQSYVTIELPSVGVVLNLRLGGTTTEQEVLDHIEYTPVDHLGCRAELSGQGPGDGAPADATAGVVCEYTDRVGGTPPQLIGSRVLSADELAVVQGLVSGSEPSASAEPEVTGRGYSTHEYLLTTPSGTTSVRTDDPFVLNPPGAMFVLDGRYLLVPGHVAPEDLPGAYP